jgi:hypothetical protein
MTMPTAKNKKAKTPNSARFRRSPVAFLYNLIRIKMFNEKPNAIPINASKTGISAKKLFPSAGMNNNHTENPQIKITFMKGFFSQLFACSNG